MSTPLFVAVGQNGLRASSPDGTDWKAQETGKEGETYRTVAAGHGVFAAVGSYGGKNITAATTDGVSWKTGALEAKYSRYLRGMVFGDGQFVALGGDPGSVGVAKPFVSLSTDGIQWSEYKEISGKFIIRRAAHGNGLYVGVGDRGRRAWSHDGLQWDDVPAAKAIDTLIDVAFGNGVFVGVGLHGLRMSTKDGATWSEPARGQEGEHLNSIVWAGDRFVAIGAGATWISPNGADWKREPNQDAPLTATFARGLFVGLQWKGRILVSRDGIAWKEVHKAEQHLEAVCAAA